MAASAIRAASTWRRRCEIVEPLPVNAESGLREPGDHRLNLYESATGRVADISASPNRPPPPGHATSYQVVLPYLGVFGYTVGNRTTVLDANRTLFVTGGQDFADSHPVPGVGHASIVIVPSAAALDELCGWARPYNHPAFRDASRPATPRLHILTHALRGLAANGGGALRADELVVSALRHALTAGDFERRPVPLRIVDRAKQLLHARSSEKLTLDEIAREVGVSAVYLTQAFTRSEGVPLYRYHMRLRLNRALVELPHRNNLTELALDLGFSSHSHFSASFKAAFGVTPSEFRGLGRY